MFEVWVLILILKASSGDSPAITMSTIEGFATMEACQDAGKRFMTFHAHSWIYYPEYNCLLIKKWGKR